MGTRIAVRVTGDEGVAGMVVRRGDDVLLICDGLMDLPEKEREDICNELLREAEVRHKGALRRARIAPERLLDVLTPSTQERRSSVADGQQGTPRVVRQGDGKAL